ALQRVADLARVRADSADDHLPASDATDSDAAEVLDEVELMQEYEGDEDLLADMVTSYFELQYV
ncbi:MAG: hypothetical protein R6W67_03220, partial [Bacteroidales bacterium]